MFTNKITGFTFYNKKPNEIHFGSLYTKNIAIPCSKESKRILRVWLPEDYDGKKSFGVLYMCDGQNIVDKCTSAYGEWNMEDHIHNLKNEGYPELILVGIDCPKMPEIRMAEYSMYPFSRKFKKSNIDYINMPSNYGFEFIDYIVNEIKPLIDKSFKTKKNFTGIGGSSMGGLFAFEAAKKYSSLFNFSICFSPALCLYKNKEIRKRNLQWDVKNMNTKFVFYSGAKDKNEKQFVRGSKMEYSYLLKQGVSKKQVVLIIDKKAFHHESCWSNHIEEALRFCLKN